MALRIHQRGPDDSGVWLNKEGNMALAHRRLSIIDPSSAGHQPMASPCGRFTLVYNGEIYNHLVLRELLEKAGSAPVWRGHSDTETLLAAFSVWGVERTSKATVGMFALALWDQQIKILTLARDRTGEKPLYYGWQKDVFLFGSELKAHPCFNADIDRGALALMLRHNCIPAPYSIYSGIQKLMPGHYLKIRIKAGQNAETPAAKPYWRLNEVVAAGLANPFDGSDEDATNALESALLASVGSQMISDVPLGAFLSGGIDSSAIVSLMQARSNRPVSTFTIGFDNKDYDEAVRAKAVAQHLGTSHAKLYVSPEDALAVIPKLPEIYCEPFSDSSQIPTYLVSALASSHVKVALSGDAGDELFGGYNRYQMANIIWGRIRRLPRSARRAVAGFLKSTSPAGWDKLLATIGLILPDRLRVRAPGREAAQARWSAFSGGRRVVISQSG
jgi:asparagine synthase (glutamine-hydrolysing)